MNRRARLRKRTLRSGNNLIHYYRDTDPKVHLDGYNPDYVFKRLWMGIAPPRRGYAGLLLYRRRTVRAGRTVGQVLFRAGR